MPLTRWLKLVRNSLISQVYLAWVCLCWCLYMMALLLRPVVKPATGPDTGFRKAGGGGSPGPGPGNC